MSGDGGAAEPRISLAGEGALLLDAGGERFRPDVQRRVWAAADLARAQPWAREATPGMNNLLVTFDPLAVEIGAVTAALREVWFAAEPSEAAGREVRMAVAYGGPDGADLAGLAAHSGFPVDEVVRRHAASMRRRAGT